MHYGASFNKDTKCIDFKLASHNAQNAILCIFKKPMGHIPFLSVEMQKEGGVFKASIPEKKLFKGRKVFYYGYRIFGANFIKKNEYKEGSDIGFISRIDSEGNRFNPNKLAYDPYSIELSHTQSAVSSDMKVFRSGGDNFLSDNSKIAPKTVFRKIKETKVTKIQPRALKDEIIAEVHLKDLTKLTHTFKKGTYKAASYFAGKIKDTGVTMVEFLPLCEFDSFAEKGNHWGYMPLNYFALKKVYASDKKPYSALYEFRKLIDEFHKRNIKVCMDVVYNHTGEGKTYRDKEDANLFSYALVDNKSYYKLAQNTYYTNHSGCGNDFNTKNPLASDIIVDSLSFFINQGVDAFRFDLAVALMDISTSGYAMYDKNGGILAELKGRLEKLGHKVLLPNEKGEGVHLIAEPWMCSGACNYQLGNFPDYFAEWNDISRETIRMISMKPDCVNPKMIREIIEGQPSKFQNKQRSINYVSSHDGFCLFDLNTYDKPNPNTSGGFCAELCSSYKNDTERQDNEIRKQILILMVSFGIPMLQFGDIFLHSKCGNNNSYNLDNEINRINYKLDKRKGKLSKYIKNLIKFRKENPIFSCEDYVNKIEYYYPSSDKIYDNHKSYWENNSSNILCFKVLDDKNNYFIAISKDKNEIELRLPNNSKNKKWYLITNTKDGFIDLNGTILKEEKYILKPYCACIFKER